MSTPAVELRQVTKVFPGSVTAVDGVSLAVAPGRVVALLGPSGCGKTTTLRLINRLEEPTTGEILVRGTNTRSQRRELLRRSIGYVIQEGGLFPHLDVSANVATVPRLLGWPRLRTSERVAEILSLVGLPEKEFGRRMPDQLSGGQRQRVGVARGLAADPDILLMDEPFGALDPATRSTVQDEFLRLQGQLHKTVILVTHDLSEAAKLADTIVLLDRGRVVQEGSIADLLLRPADARVRTFLGTQTETFALEALRLQDVVADLETSTTGVPACDLSPGLRLGRALVALVDLPEGAFAVVNDRLYLVENLRRGILHTVRVCSIPASGAA